MDVTVSIVVMLKHTKYVNKSNKIDVSLVLAGCRDDVSAVL